MCGCVSVGGGSVAESTGKVVAPAPECVVGFGGAGVPSSCADVVPGVAGDLFWGGSSSGGSVAELSVVVDSPAPE